MNDRFECGMSSPVGPLTLMASEQALQICSFRPTSKRQRHPVLDLARAELTAYFQGELKAFTMPLDFGADAPPFHRKVWEALRHIPYGQTCSYRDLAHAVGNPQAVRAVGAANGRNPIAIIVPCHRVIGADGSLTGYGGGLPNKRLLLTLETTHAPFALQPS
jgi:methylated-DNA-[protein]-cysteine S-methyltransferase